MSLINHLPRTPLAFLPTPIQELKRLRQTLGNSPRILIKRDDQTGLATGGNKTRKLEFLIADALEKGADTIITTGAAQSNHSRQTAAAAARAGLDCILVLSGKPAESIQWGGNLLLDRLFGASIHWTDSAAERDPAMQSVAAELRQKGKSPYIIPVGGSVPVGAVGYVAAVEEVFSQLDQMDETIARMVVVSGSGGTHAGVLVGVKALAPQIQVEGMNNFAVPGVRTVIRNLAHDTAKFLDLEISLGVEDFTIYDAGSHPYGVLTAAEREAIQLLARTEGILLDPVYTGRAFAHLLHLIRSGHYQADETLLFWHTGGTASLFAYAEEFQPAR